MELIRMGLLALVLAGQLAGWMLLKRELRELRLLRVREAQGGLRQDLAGMEEAQRKDMAELEKRLEALLKAEPEGLSRCEEARLSRAMEEGVMNLLRYSAGKAPGAEAGLG